jgi:hypothetical protein
MARRFERGLTKEPVPVCNKGNKRQQKEGQKGFLKSGLTIKEFDQIRQRDKGRDEEGLIKGCLD